MGVRYGVHTVEQISIIQTIVKVKKFILVEVTQENVARLGLRWRDHKDWSYGKEW